MTNNNPQHKVNPGKIQIMKLKRSVVVPAILAIYLAVMAYIGYDGYATRQTSSFQYFGTIFATIVVLVLLHFSLKRRERLRRERTDDIQDNDTK
jgi:NO-binding membrane sensor protein with MHYT domain